MVDRSIGIEEAFLIGRRDKAQLEQATRHRREAKHSQIVLVGTAVVTAGSLADLTLHVAGQFYALFAVLVGDKLEHDVALSRVEIDSLIHLLIVFLHVDDRILALGRVQVFQDTLVSCGISPTQSVGLETTHIVTALYRIDMEGDKQVCMLPVGNLCAVEELEIHIPFPRIDHPHVRAMGLHQFAESQRIAQGQVFLDGDSPRSTMIVSTVTGIDNEREPLASLGHDWHGTQHEHARQTACPSHRLHPHYVAKIMINCHKTTN